MANKKENEGSKNEIINYARKIGIAPGIFSREAAA